VTSGTGTIGGLDLQEDMDEIRKHVGVCPQNDVLWPTMSVYEHLLFYARLKGVAAADVRNAIDDCVIDAGTCDRRNLSKRHRSCRQWSSSSEGVVRWYEEKAEHRHRRYRFSRDNIP